LVVADHLFISLSPTGKYGFVEEAHTGPGRLDLGRSSMWACVSATSRGSEPVSRREPRTHGLRSCDESTRELHIDEGQFSQGLARGVAECRNNPLGDARDWKKSPTKSWESLTDSAIESLTRAPARKVHCCRGPHVHLPVRLLRARNDHAPTCKVPGRTGVSHRPEFLVFGDTAMFLALGIWVKELTHSNAEPD